MAFKGFHFAGLEWKNITASKVMWVVIAAIAIMPLLYGALYLAAFQDPYARLNTVPVAVVNEDAGAVIAGESRTLGDDVVDKLKDTDDGLEWNFVSADEAQRGLEDGTYFMTCTIPQDFSKSVASVDTDAPERAQLLVSYNQSENMLASQIGETVWKEVRQRVSDSIATEYWTTVLDRVADSGKDLHAAADGAGDLAAGLVTAKDGSQTIAENLGTLSSGAVSLDSGLTVLANGASTLGQGAGTLKGGTSALAGGLSQLGSQTSALPAQASALNAGVQSAVGAMGELSAGLGTDADPNTLVGGSYALSQGLQQVSAGASSANDGVAQIAGGIGQVNDSLASIKGGADEALGVLQSPAATDEQKIAAATQALQSISAGVGDAGSEGTIRGSLAYLQASLASVSGDAAQGTGLAYLAAAASQLSAGADTLHGGLAGVQASLASKSSDLQALSAGSAQLAEAAPQLSGAVSQLATGANQVDAGASSIASGAGELASGAQSAKSGSASIADGAAQLQEGSTTLADGLTSAVDGSTELSEKLAEGAQTAADQTGNVVAKADAMSDPVELVNSYYTTVKNYGTGFAPYFMALGLWVGGLVAGFVFKPLNSRLILSGGNPVMVAFANYLPMAVFAIIQATLLMVVLQFGLQLQIDNVPAFYAMGYLTALVFATIMQFLMAAFGFPGKFVAIILLMLQLTACAGTFPIQTTPAFFQAINPFMPMTYVVEGMRQIMTGLDYGIVVFDCAVLFAIGAVCFALTSVVAYRKRTVRMDDLHPILNLG